MDLAGNRLSPAVLMPAEIHLVCGAVEGKAAGDRLGLGDHLHAAQTGQAFRRDPDDRPPGALELVDLGGQ